MVWSAVHGWVSLRMTKCNEVWVDWRPTKRSIEAMVDLTIRGIAREPKRAPRNPET